MRRSGEICCAQLRLHVSGRSGAGHATGAFDDMVGQANFNGQLESFKSTLDEVREADLLVHIVDISHPTFEEQIEVVNRTLAEIDKTEKPMIMVFNKVDAFTFVPKEEDDLTPRGRENIDLDELKRTWMGKLQDNCIFISAKERTNIEALKEMLYERVKQIHITRFPYNDFLFQQYDEE